MTNIAFDLENNDILEIEVFWDKIIFKKNGQPNSVILDIEFSPEQWEKAHFFVGLSNEGDSVCILNWFTFKKQKYEARFCV